MQQNRPSWWQPFMEQVSIAGMANLSNYCFFRLSNEALLEKEFLDSHELDAAHWHQLRFEESFGLVLVNGAYSGNPGEVTRL